MDIIKIINQFWIIYILDFFLNLKDFSINKINLSILFKYSLKIILGSNYFLFYPER